MTTEYIVVLVTASSEEEAARLGHALVSKRLAACANIIHPVRSIYRWQGHIEDEQEVLMFIKTRKDLFELLQECVKELHSYSVPEIIALPIIEASPAYLKWLGQETSE
jgi:periplasmic divalent cation tolerance protein